MPLVVVSAVVVTLFVAAGSGAASGGSVTPPTDAPASASVPAPGAVTTGGNHTCALSAAGGVKCWGWNEEWGLVGDGTIFDRVVPVDVPGLTAGVTAISAGDRHTCAVTATGGVRCWGYGADGQLGVPGFPSSLRSPAEVVGLPAAAVSVDGGARQTCAVTVVGGATCWGAGGALGDGTDIDRATPVDVVGLTSGVAQVSTGAWHSCAVTTAGGAMCWGFNPGGELGDGTTTTQRSPVAVAGLTSGVSVIRAGSGFTCVLTSAGGVRCWGANTTGQLGDGTMTNRSTPGDVLGLTSGVRSLSLENGGPCAVTDGGAVVCWGAGQPTPTEVPGLGSGAAAVTGNLGRFDTHCAFRIDGALLCWGGRPGDGTTYQPTPVHVSGSFYRPECPTIVAGEHTRFSLSDGYAVGSTATFTADDPFWIEGPAMRTCNPGATWSGPMPIATDVPTAVPGTVTVTEGDSGTVEAHVPITLSHPPTNWAYVWWTTVYVPGAMAGQASPGEDYVASSGWLSFAPGQSSASALVEVAGDRFTEGDEYVVVSFNADQGVRMGGFWGLGFIGIVDDDGVVVPGSATVVEGDAGTTALEVPVSLSHPSSVPVSVDWITVYVAGAMDGQADPGSDYLAASGTVTFLPGETSGIATITVVGDVEREVDEYVVVSFRNPINARMGGFWGLGFGSIGDDDGVG